MENKHQNDKTMLSALKGLPILEIIPEDADCNCCSRITFQSCVGINHHTETAPDSNLCRKKRLSEYFDSQGKNN